MNPPFSPSQIVWEDNHLMAVNKLPGQIVQGDKTGDLPLSEWIKQYLKERDHKPGNVFCGVIHRLDRPVSGVVLFAKTSKALARMNELFRERSIEKTYWCVVKKGDFEPQATLKHYVVKNERTNKSFVSKQENKHALYAELEYQQLAHSDTYALLEVKPQSGRHHQIRVQLSATIGPIKGDLKYGFARSNSDGSICLHARKLSFKHPVSGHQTDIIASPPNDVVWNALSEKISA